MDASEAETRFKSAERTTRTFLTPKDYGVMRFDGRSFHTYCAGLQRPADQEFMGHMDAVAIALLTGLSGARLAYVQSDEISVIFVDWREPGSGDEGAGPQMMFGGSVQKLTSIGAAIASTTMNLLRHGTHTDKIALFDARAFSLPTREDTVDYLAWRQHDAGKNSVSMTASTHFSPKALDGKSTADRVAMLAEMGVPMDSTPLGFRRGRVIVREPQPGSTTFIHKRTGLPETVTYNRSVPVSRPAPLFAQDNSLVPAAHA